MSKVVTLGRLLKTFDLFEMLYLPPEWHRVKLFRGNSDGGCFEVVNHGRDYTELIERVKGYLLFSAEKES